MSFLKKVLREKSTHLRTHLTQPLGAEVFSINFLRRESLPLPFRRLRAYLALVYLGLSAMTLVFLLFVTLNLQLKYKKMQVSFQKEFPSEMALVELEPRMKLLRQEVSNLWNRFSLLTALQKEHFPVSDKLVGLVRTLPSRAWLTKIQGSRERRTITIEARYLIDPRHPYQIPTKQWLEALKKDPDFGRGLKSLELKKTSKVTQEKVELYALEFFAEWLKR